MRCIHLRLRALNVLSARRFLLMLLLFLIDEHNARMQPLSSSLA